MDKRSLTALEWPGLLTLLSLCATSDEGRRLAVSVKPTTNPDDLKDLHDKVSEWVSAESLQGKLSFEGYKRVSVEAPKGTFLSLETFRNLRRDLALWTHLKNWLNDGLVQKEALLSSFYDNPELHDLFRKLNKIFDERGEVADGASPELYRLRRDREKAFERAGSLLKKIMENIGSAAFSQSNPTIINGRLVLPIISAKKGLISGIQQDASSTGATVYVEPFDAVELNNSLSDFEAREREEITRILTSLTEELSSFAGAFDNLFETIEYFDLVLARARLGAKYKGIFPIISEDGSRIVLKKAFHPLLLPALNALRAEAWGEKPKTGVIPLELELEISGIKTLILSGPNGGGKTVALKTLGVLSLMNQGGIPIPVDEGTVLPVFDSVLALIGDPQSIADDSSTFTARMSHLAEGLKAVGSPFLVLLDELGSGTDPMEGAAIGKEILAYFHSRKGFLLTTTHDESIKAFALTTKGMENGAFGFSDEAQKPTYSLKMGFIGRSRAIEMARKAGIPEEIIRKAKEEIPEEGVKISRLLDDLEKILLSTEKEKELLNLEKIRLAAQTEEKENEKKQLEDEKRRLLRTLPQKMAEWRELFLTELKTEVNKQKVRVVSRKSTDKVVEKAGKDLGVEPSRKALVDFLYPPPGTWVKVHPFGFEGAIVRIDEGSGKICLERDGKEITVGIGDIEILGQRTKSETRRFIPTSSAKESSRELNLIGKTVFEAENELELFLDRAFLDGVSEVRIIHGIGTGKLRKAVRDRLKEDKRVLSFEEAPPRSGGAGATIASLNS
jgi:DNA mismatch repair protein MutS2